MSTPPASHRLSALVAELATLQAEKKALTEREAQVKAAILEATDGQSAEVGALRVVVSRTGARFDADSFRKSFPVEAFPTLYKQEVDRAAAKEALPPATMSSFLSGGNLSVTLR